MADTVTTQETEIVFIGSQHWVQLLWFREEFHGKTQLLPLCWCCRLYRRVSMWQQSHYRTMVQGISSAGVTDLSPPSQSWSQQMKGKYCSRWWIWIVDPNQDIQICRYVSATYYSAMIWIVVQTQLVGVLLNHQTESNWECSINPNFQIIPSDIYFFTHHI